MSFATGGSFVRSGCACSGLQRRSGLDLASLSGRLIPLLPAGRGGIWIFASLWLSRSRASRSFRILVSSRADRSDRLRAGWLRAARFRLAGCSAAGTAGPKSGTYAHPGVAFVVVLAISMTPKLFMAMFSVVGGLVGSGGKLREDRCNAFRDILTRTRTGAPPRRTPARATLSKQDGDMRPLRGAWEDGSFWAQFIFVMARRVRNNPVYFKVRNARAALTPSHFLHDPKYSPLYHAHPDSHVSHVFPITQS